jgi:hypothetical protein
LAIAKACAFTVRVVTPLSWSGKCAALKQSIRGIDAIVHLLQFVRFWSMWRDGRATDGGYFNACKLGAIQDDKKLAPAGKRWTRTPIAGSIPKARI